MDRTSNAQETPIPQAPSDSPRERLERLVTILLRTRMYIGSAVVVAVAGAVLSAVMVLRMPRIWRSEVTILYRDTIQTDRPVGSPFQRATLLGAKLKDLLEARTQLSSLITEFDLYPKTAARSMVDAVEEMKRNVGFRPKKGATFVISFSYGDPVTARNVTARLAEMIIAEYQRESMKTTTLNRDFLHRELVQARMNAEDASRALSSFLQKNPQFQWGSNDSPYAPQPSASAPPAVPLAGKALPADPELSAMRQKLGTMEDELRRLSQPAVTGDPAQRSAGLVAAQKQRAAAEAGLKAAQDAFDEKLRIVTPAHPEAFVARAKLDAARETLAAAERQVEAAQAQDMPGVSPPDSLDPRRNALEAERQVVLRRIDDRLRTLQAGTLSGVPPGSNSDAGTGAGANAARDGSPSMSTVELETEWHRLRLELERTREYFKSVQAKERAAQMSADAAEKKSDDELIVLDSAYLPTRPERGPERMIVAGIAATLLMSFGIAFLRVQLNDTLFDARDVRAAGGSAVLAELPRMPAPRPPPCESIVAEGAPLSDEIPVSWDPGSAAAAELHALVKLPRALIEPVSPVPDIEQADCVLERGGAATTLPSPASLPKPALGPLRVLRHRLDQVRRGEPFVVSVVSPGVGEGKTTLALRLAMILSEAGRSRVALVEGHFRRPSLAASLGLHLHETEGFSAQIQRRLEGGRGPIEVKHIAPSLVVLAEPAWQAGCSEAVHSIHFDHAVRVLRGAYDYVVIDGASVLGFGDAHVLESLSDGVLLVARAGVTRGRDLREAVRQLGDRRILGTVLNDLPGRNADSMPAKGGKAS